MLVTALISGGRSGGCIIVNFYGVFPLPWLPWLTCFETKQVAQWIIFLLIWYITQEQRSIVLIISVAIWFISQWASGNNKLTKTLCGVKQLAHLGAEAVSDWISEQVSASQSLSDKSNKEVITQINTKSRGFYLLSVVELAIALVALVVAIATYVSVNLILRLFWSGNNSCLVS